jgi:hypothetical protein
MAGVSREDDLLIETLRGLVQRPAESRIALLELEDCETAFSTKECMLNPSFADVEESIRTLRVGLRPGLILYLDQKPSAHSERLEVFVAEDGYRLSGQLEQEEYYVKFDGADGWKVRVGPLFSQTSAVAEVER